MKKEVAILAFLAVLVIGCTQQAPQGVTGKAFVGGTSGLSVSFLDSRPPDEVFDTNYPFQIGVRLENKGEFDIVNPNDIIVSVSGVNPADFKVSKSQLTMNSPQELRGVKLDPNGNVLAGDSVNMQFPQMSYASTIAGSVVFPLQANVCYEYGTQAQAKLCVRKDLSGRTSTGLCDPNGVVQAETSSAPIQFTGFKQQVSGSNKIDLLFSIVMSGAATDSIYKTGTSCDSSNIANQNVVFVQVADTGLGDLTCTGLSGGTKTSGYTTLYNGKSDIRCTQTIDSPDDFIKVMNIALKYDYMQSIQKQLKVSHSS